MDTVEKQRISDTYLTFLPKNTSGYTYQNQIIDVQIPKSQHVINLAKSFIYANIQIPLKINNLFEGSVKGDRLFVGFMNSATIFDQVQIHSNNKVIYSDTFSQVNSRIWQLSKPSKYLDANYHSFINIKNLNKNNGFIVQEIKRTCFPTVDKFEIFKFNLKIPLPCLFNCFDNVESFSTTQLNDNVTLMMQLSTLEKYLCLFETSKEGKLKKVTPFSTNNTVNLYETTILTCSSAESDKYQINEGFRIVAPGHYPTEEEKIEINNVIANGGWFRPYVNSHIQAQDVNFGKSNYENSSSTAIQTALNFNTDVSNLYSILMMASHEQSHVVFDKPKINNIELNTSELWKLANGGTHTDATYDGDNDMYLDLLNGFGTQTFKNLERFDESISHDYQVKTHEDNLYFEIVFKLTVNLNDTNNDFATDKKGEFEILERNLKNKYFLNTTPKIYSQEIDTKDHKAILTGRIMIENRPDLTKNFTNIKTTWQLDNSSSSNPMIFRFLGSSGLSGDPGTDDQTTTLGAITGTDDGSKLNFELVFGVKYIKDKEIYSKFSSDQTYGSYLQYYKFAPSNQLGYSSDYFSSQINYKFTNMYKETSDISFANKSSIVTNMTLNNYDNSTMYCCCQTLSFIVFNEGGIDIINPYSEDIDVRFQMGNITSYSGNYHGFLPGIFSPVTTLIGKGINGLRNIIKENRSHSNNTYAYSTLGKDNYEKHKDIINSNSTMKRNKFKKFINGLYQMENSINAHGTCPTCGQEEIAEFATFDDLNLKPFVQTYPAELADYEYKNQLILDYKNRFNLEKLRLNSFGSECAMEGNNYHGRVGDWFRRIGNKFRGWFKSDGKRIIKNIGSDLSNIANEYAAKIATGEISISDIKNLKPQLKSQILNIVRNSDKGTAIEGVTGDAIRLYNKYKKGEIKFNDIPSEMVTKIKELDMKEKSGENHGLIVRHGFTPGARIKPNILYSVQKQRFNRLKSMNPMQMNRKKLRKLYRFNYLKNNGVVDTSHGRLAELLRNRYPGISDQIRFDIKKRTGPDVSKFKLKWINDKKDLITADHGVSYLQKLRNKSKSYNLTGDSKYKFYHKKYKKYKSKASSSNTPDYKAMKAAWKKYKSQHKN